ncbi:hypothetical protein ACIG63_18250 [Streptomyces antimycoticus]|uniref:hypothetical protein n=1 Tax=Streptomyces antimycoticus TaxID=68175 RepID=UPI0037D83678
MRNATRPAKPAARFAASGKNVVSVTTSIFGGSPKPNQMISRGATATIGIVWEATRSGYRPRRAAAEKSSSTATSQAAAMDSAKPSRVSWSVDRVCAHRSPRFSPPCSTTRAGEGRAVGSTPATVT